MSAQADPRRQFAVEVVARLKSSGFDALWAGGCVRDLLLGKAPKDYDVATTARPEQVRKLFGHGRTVPVGASFGVMMVLGPTKDAGQVEVATFRTEGPYLDGRRPENVQFCTPEQDAHRRDFTINGMFYDPVASRVYDYVGGEKDLAAGVVRAIGNPRDRMSEDKLRMLRAVRFTATLEFTLDGATADAIRAMASEIHVVSVERIAQELRRMLVDRRRRKAMEWAESVGLLLEILPELTPSLQEGGSWETTLRCLQLLEEPTFELAFATVLRDAAYGGAPSATSAPRFAADRRHAGDAAWTVCRRLKLSNDEAERISWLLSHRGALAEARRLSKADLKRALTHRGTAELLEFHRVETIATGGDVSAFAFCRDYLASTPPEILNPPALVDGRDLKALGVPTGPKFRELLDAVREEQLNERLPTRETALEYLRQRIDGAT